jgi:hypothetical protein
MPQLGGGLHVGRVQRERALVFRLGFLGAPLEPKDKALDVVGPSPIWIEERLRLQFIRPLEVAFRVAGKAKQRRH